MKRPALAAGPIVAAATLAMAGSAYAGPRAVSKILGYVTAHSHDGNGSIRAPYRATDVGYQVRLPHGTWVYCKRSCSETLRVNTVDIWENEGRMVGAGEMANECGVFGCLELRWPR